MKKTCIIGLTGRSGTGKSTVAAYYRSLGYPVLDADAVAASIMQDYPACVAELAAAFGADILDETGTLRRQALADRAFATPDGQKKLTQITHAYIIRSLLEKIHVLAAAGAGAVFVDGAVIVDAPFEKYCHKLVVVDAEESAQIARLCERDGITAAQAQRRLDAQLPRQRLLDAADAVILNDGDTALLLQRAKNALQRLELTL